MMDVSATEELDRPRVEIPQVKSPKPESALDRFTGTIGQVTLDRLTDRCFIDVRRHDRSVGE